MKYYSFIRGEGENEVIVILWQNDLMIDKWYTQTKRKEKKINFNWKMWMMLLNIYLKPNKTKNYQMQT